MNLRKEKGERKKKKTNSKLKQFLSLCEVQKSLLDKKITCVELVKGYLSKISKASDLNIFIETFDFSAFEKAKEIDEKILKKKKKGKLFGMVVGIKDNICYKDHKCSASSMILENFESLYSATVVERLLNEDAIIIGRLNCDEFAMGSANKNTIYGTVKNPLNNEKVAGGSSGGSAAAVAADLCLAALGSDTGGSVRQPASFCGVVGLKPTYSRVSRYGLIAYSSSFDQIGPITKNIDDAALILEVISGRDPFDNTTSSRKKQNYSDLRLDKKYKIAYIKNYLENEEIDPEIKDIFFNQVKKIQEKGYKVDALEFNYVNQLIPTYYVLTTAEASSNLARFDGVHFGYRSKEAVDLESTYTKTRTRGFGDEVKRRIMLGTFVLSSGYQEEYFTKAQKIRRLIQKATDKIFNKYDFLILPTTPRTAFDIDQKTNNPTKEYLEDIFTVQANLAGNPAISLPLSSHSNGLPVGIQLMSDKFKEHDLLKFSKFIYK